MWFKLLDIPGDYKDKATGELKTLLVGENAIYTPTGKNVGCVEFDTIQEAMANYNIRKVSNTTMKSAILYKSSLIVFGKDGSHRNKLFEDMTADQLEPMAYLENALGQFTELEYDKETNIITIDGISMKANELNATELLDWVEGILNGILNE